MLKLKFLKLIEESMLDIPEDPLYARKKGSLDPDRVIDRMSNGGKTTSLAKGEHLHDDNADIVKQDGINQKFVFGSQLTDLSTKYGFKLEPGIKVLGNSDVKINIRRGVNGLVGIITKR